MSDSDPSPLPPTDRIEVSPADGFVILVEIARFPMLAPPTQRQRFTTLLNECLRILEAENLTGCHLFPKGDGLFITIAARERHDEDEAEVPLTIARKLLQSAARQGVKDFKLRVAIDYNRTDNSFDVRSPSLQGLHHLQIGNGLNITARIIHFAEDNEVILSADYIRNLKESGFEELYEFEKHKQVYVKYVGDVVLYSYKPAEREADYIYKAPTNEERRFKRFAFFPPLDSATVDRFREVGLRRDLQDVLEYTYETIASVNQRRSFLTWANVYETLKRVSNMVEDELDGELLILSRSDRKSDFWCTEESRDYLTRLKLRSSSLRQVRIFMYDPRIREPLEDREVRDGLRELHEPGTLLKIDREFVTDNLLAKFLFGVTIYPSLSCAVAPLPAPGSYNEYVDTLMTANPEDMFGRFINDDFEHTDFKALVIADPAKVDRMIQAFRELQTHRATAPLVLH
jgi:hypothetical protein